MFYLWNLMMCLAEYWPLTQGISASESEDLAWNFLLSPNTMHPSSSMNFLKWVKLQNVHGTHVINTESLYPLWNNVLQLTFLTWQRIWIFSLVQTIVHEQLFLISFNQPFQSYLQPLCPMNLLITSQTYSDQASQFVQDWGVLWCGTSILK